MSLKISTLGSLKIEVNGEALANLPSRAAEALLVYLACHPHPVSRDTLATLLWEGRAQQNARGNLRTILSALRQVLGDYLIVTRYNAAFNHHANYRLDCAEFERLLAQFDTDKDIDALQNAMALYGGDFLAGFRVRDGYGFEEWALQEESRLQGLALTGWRNLAAQQLQNDDAASGVNSLNRLLAIDPYNEAARRELMLALFRRGERNAALKSYQDFQAQLRQKLDVEPETATQALYQRLKKTACPPPNNLPPPIGNFVGRVAETAQIKRLLTQPNCRLISILGAGGVGKTSLSLQAVRQTLKTHPGQFLDGVFFTPLASLQSSSFLSTTLAETLKFNFHGKKTSQAQLFDFLRQKELLLVLDNFEHLIAPDSIKWLARLLDTAPAVKVLLTSQERLNLQEEHVIDLRGLPYPAAATENAASFSAVQLFTQHAKRVQHTFNPQSKDMAAIVQLCQLVDGMPLAIELAAAETRYFSCRHIAAEIQKRLDFQSAPAHNRPARHISLRAAIEYSWALLAESERIIDVARRLAVFYGAFDLAAATKITNAAPRQLISLVDRSFLQRNERGLFEIHPLIHQFLAEKLADSPAEELTFRNRHVDYYAALAITSSGAPGDNMERHYFEVLRVVQTHLDNIIAAAIWLARRRDFSQRRLASLIETLIFYFLHTHHYQQWKAVFRKLRQSLLETPDNSAKERWLALVLSSRIAEANIHLHAYGRAKEQLRAIMDETRALGNAALLSVCLEMESILAVRAGDFSAATAYAKQALAAIETHSGQYQWPVYRTLGDIALASGDLLAAQTAHEKAFALAVEMDSRKAGLSVYKLAMGTIARRQGRLEKARLLLNEALNAARVIGKQEEIIACLIALGRAATDSGDFDGAQLLLAEGAALNDALNDYRQAALLALAQGRLAEAKQDFTGAQQFYAQSVDTFEEIDDRANLSNAQRRLAQVERRMTNDK